MKPRSGSASPRLYELIDLAQCGEVVPDLGRGGARGQDAAAWQLDRPGDVVVGNESVSFMLHRLFVLTAFRFP